MRICEEISSVIANIKANYREYYNPEIFDTTKYCLRRKIRDEYSKEEILIRKEKEKLLEDINFYLENYIPKNDYEKKIKNERKDSWYQILLDKKKNYLKYKIEPFNKQNFEGHISHYFEEDVSQYFGKDISQYFKKYIPKTPYEKFMKDNLHDEWSQFLWKKQEYHRLFNKYGKYILKKTDFKIVSSYEFFLLMYEISFYYKHYVPKNEEEMKLKQGPYLEYEKLLKEKQKEDLSAIHTESDELGYQEDINWYIKHQKPRNPLEKFFKENMQEHWLEVLKEIQKRNGILCGKIDDYI